MARFKEVKITLGDETFVVRTLKLKVLGEVLDLFREYWQKPDLFTEEGRNLAVSIIAKGLNKTPENVLDLSGDAVEIVEALIAIAQVCGLNVNKVGTDTNVGGEANAAAVGEQPPTSTDGPLRQFIPPSQMN